MQGYARVVVATIAALWINGASADGTGTGPNSWIGYVFGNNQATGSGSAVAAGTFNLAGAQGAFVGAGTANHATGISSLVIGGFSNRATAIDSLVGAGAGNLAMGARSVIVGGGYNLATGQWSFIGGGGRDGTSSAPAGSNTLLDNRAYGRWSVIGGGRGNVTGVNGAGDTSSSNAVVGGVRNVASGRQSFVGGGACNVASGWGAAVVGGGQRDDAFGCADGNVASGENSFIAGGASNVASGALSFAAGYGAHADNHQCFLFAAWGDPTVRSNCLGTTHIARFNMHRGIAVDYHTPRVDGGGTRWVGIGDVFAGQTIATWTGGFLSNTGIWTNNSDAARKTDFESVDAREILARVSSMPIKSWRYDIDDTHVRHIGPVAQDFHAAFGLGTDDKHIGTIDADGVALAAIQGLHQLMQEKDARIAALEAETRHQREALAELRRSLELVLARSSPGAQLAQR